MKESQRLSTWNSLAVDYREEIISPFRSGKENLVTLVRGKALKKRYQSILDLGCGPGDFIPGLSSMTPSLTALDGSSKMIELCQQKYSALDNIEYKKITFSNLGKMKQRFQMIVAVNSVLDPDPSFQKKIWKSLDRLIQPGGELFVLVPSMESWQRQYQDVVMASSGALKTRSSRAARVLESERMDFGTGAYDTGDLIQKHYTLAEMFDIQETTGFIINDWQKFSYKKGVHFAMKKIQGIRLSPMWDWLVHFKKDRR